MPIKFKIGALTDVGLARTNNEDNLLIIPDLAIPNIVTSDLIIDLGAKGALMVVADGMGGMNAGEVASETAINSIKTSFSPINLTPQATKDDLSIVEFMNNAILTADHKIKAAAMRNPESQGMGTTIVLAWILGSKLYVSWCGDSRAYVFNSAGLHQITKDHSYVQSLVDQGEITHEQAFNYPESNVITRSLCDTMDAAEPENLYKPYPLANGDTIILCTDGVSSMLRDSELEQVIGSSPDDINSLMTNIKESVYKTGATDNLTMCVAQIVDGALPVPNPDYFQTTDDMLNGKIPSAGASTETATKSAGKTPWKIIAIAAIAAAILAVAAVIIFGGKEKEKPKDSDNTKIENPDTPDKTQPVPAPAPTKPNPGGASSSGTQTPNKPDKPSTPTPSTQGNHQSSEVQGALNAISNYGNNNNNNEQGSTEGNGAIGINGGGGKSEPQNKPEENTNIIDPTNAGND